MNDPCQLVPKPKSPLTRRLGGLLLATLTVSLVPMLYGAGLTISGVPSALACSAGSAPVPTDGVSAFHVLRGEAVEQLAVANDGFFVIDVTGVFASPEDLRASIVVGVSNAAGEPVAGSLHTFSSTTGLYWLADTTLVDGTYTATVSAPSRPELAAESVQLAAKGTPSKLELPSLEPRKWLDVHQLTGGRSLTCNAPGGCGPLQFGELEESSPGLDLRVFPSTPLNGQVYWVVDVESADSSDAQIYWSGESLFTRNGDETGVEFHFAKTLPEYCAVVTVRDLRNDQRLTSAPICWKPGPAQVDDRTDIIAGCPEAPSPALRAVWCRHHADLNQCRGVTGDVIPGTAGTAGTAEGGDNPALPANAGAAGVPHTGAIAEGDGARDEASSACGVGHSRGASSLGGAGLVALAALVIRRRRRP